MWQPLPNKMKAPSGIFSELPATQKRRVTADRSSWSNKILKMQKEIVIGEMVLNLCYLLKTRRKCKPMIHGQLLTQIRGHSRRMLRLADLDRGNPIGVFLRLTCGANSSQRGPAISHPGLNGGRCRPKPGTQAFKHSTNSINRQLLGNIGQALLPRRPVHQPPMSRHY